MSSLSKRIIGLWCTGLFFLGSFVAYSKMLADGQHDVKWEDAYIHIWKKETVLLLKMASLPLSSSISFFNDHSVSSFIPPNKYASFVGERNVEIFLNFHLFWWPLLAGHQWNVTNCKHEAYILVRIHSHSSCFRKVLSIVSFRSLITHHSPHRCHIFTQPEALLRYTRSNYRPTWSRVLELPSSTWEEGEGKRPMYGRTRMHREDSTQFILRPI